MGITKSQPIRFTPKGLVDAFDSTDEFQGACRSLQNLVFDQSNPELVVARPGVGDALTNFDGFIAPRFVSLQVAIGSRVYGMVSTGLTPGYDQPFCYDLETSSFITISGVSSGNVEGRPVTPPVFGAWNPPTLAVIGVKIIITHPGYSGSGSNFFGIIDISNPASPAYSTANTATNVLPSVPTAVANLGNRAYYACGNMVFYSDVLAPDVMTNAGQALTVGDSSHVTALGGLPVLTATGGAVAALLVFKKSQVWQITGDAAVGTSLSMNYISLSVGTEMPRSVVPSPLGTFFGGPDCAYIVSPSGALAPVCAPGSTVPDLREPFGYVTEPTRVAAAFAGNIYRICIPTQINGLDQTYDYWFDTRKMRWNGPHTFSYDCASSAGTYFVLSGQDSKAKLFRSDQFHTSNTLYYDNGVIYDIELESSELPKRNEMTMKQVVESTIELSSTGKSVTYTVTALDEDAETMDSVPVITKVIGGIWGETKWLDGTLWHTAYGPPRTYPIRWTKPLVFNKMAIRVSCKAQQNVAIGTMFFRTQYAGYMLQDLPEPYVAPVTNAVAFSSETSPYVIAYISDTAGFGAKYADPSTAVSSASYDVSFAPDGASIIMAETTSPYIGAYSWSSSGFGTKFPDPSVVPSGSVMWGGGVAVSPTSDAVVMCLAVSDSSVPIVAYQWDSLTGFGGKYSDPVSPPGYPNGGIAFSPDGKAVVMNDWNEDIVTAYQWDSLTGFGTKYSGPFPPPSSDGWSVCFSPSGNAIAIGSNSSPFIAAYAWDSITGFGAKYADPSTLPADGVKGISFSPSGDAVVVTSFTSPFIEAYSWNSSTGFGTKFSDPVTLPPGPCLGVKFAPSGDRIYVSCITSPYVLCYEWSSGGFGAKLDDPTDIPAGVAIGVTVK